VEVSGPFRSLARAEFVPGYGCRLGLPGNRPLPTDATSHAVAAADGFAPADAVAAAQPAIAAAIDRVFHDAPGKPPKRVKAVVVVKDGRVIA
jgi:hypothetical protein